MNYPEFKTRVNSSLNFSSIPEDWDEQVNDLYTIFKKSIFSIDEFIPAYFDSANIDRDGYELKEKQCPFCHIRWEKDSDAFGCWNCGYIR
jgi:hypothetical protein